MNNQRETVKYSLKNQLNSTQIDTYQWEPSKMLRSTNQFPKTNSIDKSAESSEDEKYKEKMIGLVSIK
jgi:hypothetical protein